MADETPWLTTREAAKYLRVGRNYLLRIPRDQLPFGTISTRGDRRYKRDDLDAFLTSQPAVDHPEPAM